MLKRPTRIRSKGTGICGEFFQFDKDEALDSSGNGGGDP
jgi:hypothetical protein